MLLGQVALVALFFAVPQVSPSSATPTGTTVPPISHGLGLLPYNWSPSMDHLKHVITVVMENHDYDSFFGTYCTSVGPVCSNSGNGLPAHTCVPNIPGKVQFGCTYPYNLTRAQMNITPDLNHDWISGYSAWDHGLMDNFYEAEGGRPVTFGHYNGTTVPIYWDMAEEYALGDDMFAANLSYSLPNHWYLVAGQAPNITQVSKLHTATQRTTYLDEAANTSTVEDLLNGSGVSWKYYDSALSPWPVAISTVDYTSATSAYDYWNPMASRNESYQSWYVNHFVPRSQILTDLANNSLPQVSWVIPAENISDHPGYNETPGQEWVAQLVDAVEDSPEWNSTAIFIVWDDYGGWYDSVAPPRVDSNLLSFRSPFLVISPYARENFISHQFVDFFSLLGFIEWQFRLGCLTPLDCNAPLPWSFFDFNQTARAPDFFDTSWATATYPMALQTDTPTVCSACYTIAPWMWPADSDETGNVSLDT